MLFFGFHMLLGRTPEKKVFSNFLLSRRLMGTALLILSANYAVHLFYAIRLKDVHATILMNLSTYFLCYWLFSSAMMTLLDNRYITFRRFGIHLAIWFVYSVLSGLALLLPDGSKALPWGIAGLAALLVIYGMFLSWRLLRTYAKAIRMFENTHSDDIGSYIRWLSVFTYWAIGFGVGCGLLTFLPDEYVFLWILSSIPFYIYLYCCYQNYILFYEKVENAFQEGRQTQTMQEATPPQNMADEDMPSYYADLAVQLKDWMAGEGFRQPGITINELAILLGTNRTYLSEYINSVFRMSFRDWITDLRIEYAKRLIKSRSRLKIQEVSELSGFISPSHFTRTFSAKEGCSPARWRRIHRAQDEA